MFLASVCKVVRQYLDANKRATIISASLSTDYGSCIFPNQVIPSPHWAVYNFGLFEDKNENGVNYKKWILSKTNATYETDNGEVLGGSIYPLIADQPRRVDILTLNYDNDFDDVLQGFPFDTCLVNHILIDESQVNRFDMERKLGDLGYLRVENNLYVPSARLLMSRMSIRKPPNDIIRRRG